MNKLGAIILKSRTKTIGFSPLENKYSLYNKKGKEIKQLEPKEYLELCNLVRRK